MALAKLISLCCETPIRRVQIGWLSLQPDGAISFGSNQKTFIAKKDKIRIPIWSAYNRVELKFDAVHSPDELEGIRNPHFTFHPDIRFHLKDDITVKNAIFEGLADPIMSVSQQGKMPWARLISSLVRNLPDQKQARSSAQETTVCSIKYPSEEISAVIEVDFLPFGTFARTLNDFIFEWHKVTVRVAMFVTYPQLPRLYWFHSY